MLSKLLITKLHSLSTSFKHNTEKHKNMENTLQESERSRELFIGF